MKRDKDGDVHQEYIDMREAAKYIGVGVRTICRLMKNKKLKYCKIGSSVRFRKTDIDWMMEQSIVNKQ